MKKYIVSYDLKAPNKDYGPLIAKLKTADRWCRIHASAWVIWSQSKDAKEIFSILSQVTDSDDSLSVLPLSDAQDWQWKNLPPDVSSSLINNW
jgi:hypothetical protein